MYLEHFGLRESPFSLTPDTSFFINHAGYQDALNVLLVALRNGEGFVKVVGEVGTGKTLLCRKLLNILGDDFVTAYIHNPYLDPPSLLQAVADELSVVVDPEAGQHLLLKQLGERLVAVHNEGRRVVLCLDEVQAMPVETLEVLRLLTNLETEKRKLLQVVLFGQPELDVLLRSKNVRQLTQRITFSYRLLPMNRPATEAYVTRRMALAGYQGVPCFDHGALKLLYRHSGGTPRLINVLCHKALMAAYGKGVKRVNRRLLRLAVADTASVREHRSGRSLRWPWNWRHSGVTSAGLLLGLAITVVWQG